MYITTMYTYAYETIMNVPVGMFSTRAPAQESRDSLAQPMTSQTDSPISQRQGLTALNPTALNPISLSYKP